MRVSRCGLWFSLSLWVAVEAGTAQSSPTHRLAQPFETTVGGRVISLPAGSAVTASPGDGKAMMVRHTLPDGSTTLLFIPVASLTGLDKEPAAPPPAATPSGARSVATPTPAPSPSPAGVPLTTLDGRTVVGRILRIDPRHVVVVGDDGMVVDVPVKALDKASQERVGRWKSQAAGKPALPDPRLVPGKKFELVFPDLGKSRSAQPTRIQIRVPDNYRPDRPAPLALYLAGGEGGDNCDPAGRFVDSSEWIMVAFPYPADAPRPLHAFREGKSRDLIAFQEPMLERLQAILPNTDPKRRVVIGTSNGAHMIGIAACDGWKDFADYFSAFVLHEGGGSASWDFSALRRKDVFVLMGGKSESLGFSEGVVSHLKKARIKPEVFVAPDEGHGMGEASREAIRQWVSALPAR